MITDEMKSLIERNTIGLVATVTPEGRPAVSPKGTSVVLGPTTIAFSDLRSPGTIRNIAANPAVEINYIDVLARKACRITGHARYVAKGDAAFSELRPHFETWDTLVPRMKGFVVVDVEAAQLIRSPAYDVGGTEAELVAHWRKYYGG